MKSKKAIKTALLSLGLACTLTLTGAALSMAENASAVYAAPTDRYVALDGNSVFYTSIRGADITESEPVREGEGDEAKDHYYTLFSIGENETIAYRQNLAYSWLAGNKDEDEKYTDGYTSNRFSMEISFANLNFKRYIIKFQSQQYVLTEDEKTDNYLIFTPAADGGSFTIKVAQSIEEDEDGKIKDEQVIEESFATDARIKIEFGAYLSGNYHIIINGKDSKATFNNVYEPFANYVASGDASVTPLTFSAEFAEDATEKAAQMVLYDINGQSFEMYQQSGGSYSIKDTASPVMCFTRTPSYLEYGKSIGLQYRVIDVLAVSPRSTAYYYVLTGEQYASDTFDYDKIYYDTDDDSSSDDTEGEDTEKEESPFIQVSSSSSARIIRDNNTFIPSSMIDSNVYGLVKIYYEISDINGSSAHKDTVFVDWYANEDALVDVYQLKGDAHKTSKFLKLIDGKDGASYADGTEVNAEDAEAAYKSSVEKFEAYYSGEIEKAIAKLEDGKLYAGGKKFYLPAIEWNFIDDYFTASDYKYSIYYKAKTTGSQTSLDFNKLAIDLSEADVTYRFTIYITDAFDNPMRYPVTENGEIVWKEIDKEDVWNEDYAELLPFFEVDVSYKEATAENPENLSLAYVGTTYNGVSFDIKGVSGTYTSVYKLYVFDRNAFNREIGEVLDYNTFNENLVKLFKNEYKEGVNTRKYFTTVKASSQLLESDVNYEEHKALNWNATSISFTPQSVEDFYVVELNLKDNRSQTQETKYATVAASVQTTSLKGESDWAANNMTSIILLSVAGVCLIALIVLLIVKPKDKGDIDAIYTDVTEKEKTKRKNKNN